MGVRVSTEVGRGGRGRGVSDQLQLLLLLPVTHDNERQHADQNADQKYGQAANENWTSNNLADICNIINLNGNVHTEHSF